MQTLRRRRARTSAGLIKISFHLTPSLLERLDELAIARGLSRAAIIDELLTASLPRIEKTTAAVA